MNSEEEKKIYAGVMEGLKRIRSTYTGSHEDNERKGTEDAMAYLNMMMNLNAPHTDVLKSPNPFHRASAPTLAQESAPTLAVKNAPNSFYRESVPTTVSESVPTTRKSVV